MKIRLAPFSAKIVTAGAILLLGLVAWAFWPDEKKHSITLEDGSVITVEKAKLVSLWPEKFRAWLGDEPRGDRFLTETLGWERDWRFKNFSSWDDHSGHAIVLEVSLTPPGRYKNLNRDPALWLDIDGKDIVRIDGAAFNGPQRLNYVEIMEEMDTPGRFRCVYSATTSRAVEVVELYISCMNGRDEYVSIPLVPEERMSNASAETPVSPAQVLPQETLLNGESSIGQVARLEHLPVYFEHNEGIKILKDERDVTEDFHISRDYVWGPLSDEHQEAWGANFMIFPKSPQSVPPDKLLMLPPIKIPEAAEYLKWESKAINPRFRECELVLFGPGAYCFSMDYTVPGGQRRVEVAAKNKKEKRAEFEKLLRQPKVSSDPTDLLMSSFDLQVNGVYLGIEKKSFYFFETKCPLLWVVAGGGWNSTGPELPHNAALLLWQETPERWDWFRARVGAGVPINGGRARPGDTLQLALCDGSPMYAWFSFVPTDADRAAWAAHREAENAKAREKEKVQDDTAEDSAPPEA